MAIADAGHASGFVSGSQSSQSWACSATIAIGTTVVVMTWDQSGTAGTTANQACSDSKGNSYTCIAVANPAANVNGSMFYSTLTTGLTTSDTFTHTAPAAVAGATWAEIAVSISGFTANDSAVTNTFTGTTGTPSVTGHAATISGDINIGFAITTNAVTLPGAPWATAPPTSSNNFSVASWQTNAGTAGLTFNPTLTSAAVGLIIAAWKPTVSDVLQSQSVF